jgi:methylglutaconyl-CoA hydratase
MKQIQFKVHSDVAEVQLHGSGTRNAFHPDLIKEIGELFLQLGLRKDLKAIILSASGSVFCSGVDLNWLSSMSDKTWDENREDAQSIASMLWAIRHCSIPVVARVQGDAYAGGVALIAACDYRVASVDAHFWISEGKLGPIPLATMPYINNVLGDTTASSLAATAERFNAQTAQRIGLLHEVVPVNQLDLVIEHQINTNAIRQKLTRNPIGNPSFVSSKGL